MFAVSNTRFGAFVRDGLDLAVEFATLGEYRLPDRGLAPVATEDVAAASRPGVVPRAGAATRQSLRSVTAPLRSSSCRNQSSGSCRFPAVEPSSSTKRRKSPGSGSASSIFANSCS